jgi:DNA (cytosine-5)-methyltransferase 1
VIDHLVLSLFPGIGLLDMAFEEEGFCVVRGPDLLWGGDIHQFHPPVGKFEGVIGGPPCVVHSNLTAMVKRQGYQIGADLTLEFVRCVREAQPEWWLMENVDSRLIVPHIPSYFDYTFVLNNRWLGGVQYRKRRFWFGHHFRLVQLSEYVELCALERLEWFHAVKARGTVKPGTEHIRGKRFLRDYGFCSSKTVKHSLVMQGIPEDFLDHAPFTVEGKQRVIGNGVPLPMGRAIALAIKTALARLREEGAQGKKPAVSSPEGGGADGDKERLPHCDECNCSLTGCACG